MFKVFHWKSSLLFLFAYLLIAGGWHLIFPDIYIWREFGFWSVVISAPLLVGFFYSMFMYKSTSSARWGISIFFLFVILISQFTMFDNLRQEKIKEYISLVEKDSCTVMLVGYIRSSSHFEEFTFSTNIDGQYVSRTFPVEDFPHIENISINPQKNPGENVLVIGTPEIFEEMDCYDTVYPTTGERLVGFQMKP